jgi:hypothetical protein
MISVTGENPPRRHRDNEEIEEAENRRKRVAAFSP